MTTIKQNIFAAAVASTTIMAPTFATAAQLSNDAKSSIPKDVQQLIVVDYRAMQNSSAAMELKDRVLPPELKRLETALKSSGLKVDQDADVLAFAAFRDPKGREPASSASPRASSTPATSWPTSPRTRPRPDALRNYSIYPMGSSGMSVVFLNQTTMVFGDKDAVDEAMDARDGLAPDFLSNGDMVNEMGQVDTKAVWSLLDARGTQTMMKGVLGDAAQLADYDTVKNRMKSSRYTMDFQNGVKFDMAVVMSDTITAATAATLMKGVAIMRKTSGSPLEKSALDADHHRLKRRHPDRRLLVLRQPVRQPPHLPALPVRSQVTYRK